MRLVWIGSAVARTIRHWGISADAGRGHRLAGAAPREDRGAPRAGGSPPEAQALSTAYVAWKPALDAVLAGVLLVLTSPVLLVALLLVRLTSRGPAFYSQTRLGQGGRPFTIYKLRSMYLGSEQTGAQWSRPGDPRITPIGRILRRTHLDEVPQFWNVLRGEMSLVGPRPERPEIIAQLEQALPDYRDRLLVRPGMTGLAQVQLPPDTDLAGVRRKLNYDLYYVRRHGPGLDGRILLSTVFHVVGVPARSIAWLFRFPDESVVAGYAFPPGEVASGANDGHQPSTPAEVWPSSSHGHPEPTPAGIPVAFPDWTARSGCSAGVLVPDRSSRFGGAIEPSPLPPRRGPSPTLGAPAWPRITVVVPVRNEESFLGRTLDQLMAQSYPADRFEVLVVDGGSTDATRSIAESYQASHPNLRILDNPGRLSSVARNIGIRHARGELIVIVDGHCELNGLGYLREVAEAFERSGADCLGRPQPLGVGGATALQQAIAAARSCRLGHHPASFIYTTAEQFVPAQSVAVAYRRSVFDVVGLFDESFDACEDVELNHRIDRAGLRCYFTPKVAARYCPRSSLRGLFRQMVRYGRGRVRLLRKHPDTFSVAGFVPAAWLAGLLVGPVVASAWPTLWAPYGAALLAYAGCLVLATVAVLARTGAWRYLGWLPLVLMTIHAGSGYGIVCEALRIGQPRLSTSQRNLTCTS